MQPTNGFFDVIFIGGGPAGYVGAIRCAQLGLSTAVVEREGLGGTCVLWGCIPAKALLESASLANKVRTPPDFGVTVGEVKLDYGVAMKRSRAVSTQNSKGVEFLFKKNKITWIKGTGTLAGKNSVIGEGADGKEEKHEAKKGDRHLHRLAREGPAADRARAQQDDRDLLRRSADPREGAEDDGHHRRRRRRLRVRRCLQRVRHAGHAHRSAAGHPPARGRRLLAPSWRTRFKKRKIDVLTGAKICEREGRQRTR